MKMNDVKYPSDGVSDYFQSHFLDRRENSRYFIDEGISNLNLNIDDFQIDHTQVINISQCGFSLKSKIPLPSHDRISINLLLKDNRKVQCLGKVIWNYENNKNYYYGVQIYYFKEDEHRKYYHDFLGDIVCNAKVVNRRVKERRNTVNSEIISKRSKPDRRNTKSLFIKCLRYNRMKALINNNKYFYLTEQTSVSRNRVMIGGKEYINFASNNYLGLSTHPEVMEAAERAIEKYGIGMCGSRVLNGTSDLHNQLEYEISRFVGGEDCILYTTGYSANVGLISAITEPDDIIIIDEQAHASIIDGCHLSGNKYIKYRHNDMNDLAKKIDMLPQQKSKLLMTEGVFSMEGDIGKIDKIFDVIRGRNIALAVDDAHAIGVLGKGGRGSSEHFNLLGKIDVVVGTISKSLGGIGGFVVANNDIVHFLKHNSRSFIFSASLPPSICAATIKAIDLIKNTPAILEQLWNNIRYFTHRVVSLGFDIGKTESPIIPLIFKDEAVTYEVNRLLLNYGIYASPVVYPAVKRKESRIRIGLMSTHTLDDLDYLATKLEDIRNQIGILKQKN